MKNIFLMFLLASNIIFASSFEFDFSSSIGGSCVFNKYSREIFSRQMPYDYDMGATVNLLLSLGRNDKINNNVLTSISSMVELGYGIYYREVRRSSYSASDVYEYNYQSFILGYLFRLNFHNRVSLGIGAGISIPLYLTLNEENIWLGEYSHMTKFNQKNIAFMYKIPFMPYMKLNLVRYFYFSERWAFKIGGNLTYNFGMELDKDRLYRRDIYWGNPNVSGFSCLDIEIYMGISFGRAN